MSSAGFRSELPRKRKRAQRRRRWRGGGGRGGRLQRSPPARLRLRASNGRTAHTWGRVSRARLIRLRRRAPDIIGDTPAAPRAWGARGSPAGAHVHGDTWTPDWVLRDRGSVVRAVRLSSQVTGSIPLMKAGFCFRTWPGWHGRRTRTMANSGWRLDWRQFTAPLMPLGAMLPARRDRAHSLGTSGSPIVPRGGPPE